MGIELSTKDLHCKKCGAELDVDSIFCSYCGTKVNSCKDTCKQFAKLHKSIENLHELCKEIAECEYTDKFPACYMCEFELAGLYKELNSTEYKNEKTHTKKFDDNIFNQNQFNKEIDTYPRDNDWDGGIGYVD